jgi:hypothetical protein
MQEWGRRFLWIYLTLTLGLALGMGILLLRYGSSGFYAIQTPGPGSSLVINFIAFCISWVFLGFLLYLRQFPRFAKRHAVFLVVFVLIGFSYLNTVREPHQIVYGDFWAYFLAAVDMSKGQPIEQDPTRLYLYPPLLATLLAPFVSLGMETLAKTFHLLNYIALLLLVVLLYLALQQYRFSRELAAIVLFCMMAANVPISRTLIYHQINLHVANLILLSLLLFGSHNFWSALSLSLAIHLKVYPLILVLPFLYQKEWRWCAWFAASQGVIIAATSVMNSPRYYLDFFSQVGGITETALRNVSVDAFVYNTLRLSDPTVRAWGKTIAHVLRLVLAAGVLSAYVQLSHQGTFLNEVGSRRVILNSYVILPLLMIAVSPSIWPHHFVFLMLTILVLFSALREAWEWWLYLFVYLFLFLVPIYDIYPMSYLRLLAIVILIALFNAVAKHKADSELGWFRSLKSRLTMALG